MDRERAIQFCCKYAEKCSKKDFYQPVIFDPGIIEIRGKWHEETLQLADIVLADCCQKSVLDLGCMNGFFLYESIRKGAKLAVGVEKDTAEISIGEEIKDILGSPVKLIHSAIEDYIPDSFDIVLMMNVIHVLNNPKHTISRFLNASKKVLVIEYRSGHEDLFPRHPDRIIDSPRSEGRRKVAFFSPCKQV